MNALSCNRFRFGRRALEERIVGVSSVVSSIESRPIIRIERCVEFQTPWKIGVSNEMTPKSNGIDRSLVDCLGGGFMRETISADQDARKEWPEHGGSRSAALILHPGSVFRPKC